MTTPDDPQTTNPSLIELADRIAKRSRLPFQEVWDHVSKLPAAVAAFVGTQPTDLALSVWVVMQLTDDECETYWMHGYPKTEGECMQ